MVIERTLNIHSSLVSKQNTTKDVSHVKTATHNLEYGNYQYN